jgi:hypothetical protein
MCVGYIYGDPRVAESIACTIDAYCDSSVHSPSQNGRCADSVRACALSSVYRTGIGACTRFADTFITLVSAMTVAPRSCPKPPTAPTIARTANPARVRYGRMAHAPRNPRAPPPAARACRVPERCVCSRVLYENGNARQERTRADRRRPATQPHPTGNRTQSRFHSVVFEGARCECGRSAATSHSGALLWQTKLDRAAGKYN